MEADGGAKEEYYYNLVPRADWFIKLLSFQSDIIYNSISTVLSPFRNALSMLFESYRRTEAATATVESTVLNVPSKLTHGSAKLVRKFGFGIIGAVHVFVVSIFVMILATFLGFGLVQLLIDKPVFLREKLFFDYTDVNPKALFDFGHMGVPVSHTFQVSLELLMPDSYYNREMGVFQLTAELLSAKGVVIKSSSQPCMLRHRSLLIRFIRTCMISIPLVLGISEETQRISIEILKHKEGSPRTKAIKVTLIPRAGTSNLPQLYEAEILMNSKLPWTKQLLRNWRWTVSVWVTFYMYTILLISIICCCRPLLFPMTMMSFGGQDRTMEPQIGGRDQREISELVQKWKQRRKKRKAIFMQGDVSETVGSSASSMSITREDTSSVLEEEIGDSESVCLD